jgi:hypothetical protein
VYEVTKARFLAKYNVVEERVIYNKLSPVR